MPKHGRSVFVMAEAERKRAMRRLDGATGRGGEFANTRQPVGR